MTAKLYVSWSLFSFCQMFDFQFFPFLFKHSLFPQKFLSVVDLSLALWRNRIKLMFPCFYRNQLTFIFFQPYSLPEFWGTGPTYLYFFPFLLAPMSSNQENDTAFVSVLFFFLIRTGFPFSKTLICSILSRKWKWMPSTKILQDNIKFHQNHLCSSCLNSMAFSIFLRNKS